MAADTLSLALKATAWGLLSAISLIIGAAIGVVRNPSKSFRAMLMAYGSGALIEALSIELFAHIVHMSEQGASSSSGGHRRLEGSGPGKGLVYVAMAMALLGASCFAGLNKILNDAGGFARHASSLQAQVRHRRLIFYSRLAAKLKLVPMFGECLNDLELRELASMMKKDFFEEGETIFNSDECHTPIYFLLSGSVQLEMVGERHHHTGRQPSKLEAMPLLEEQHDEVGRISPILDSDEPKSEGDALPGDSEGSSIVNPQESQELPVVDSYIVKRHQLFGEMVIVTGKPQKVQAIALEDSKALKLLTHDFIDLLEANTRMMQFLAKSAASSMRHTHLFHDSCEESMGRLAAVMKEVVWAKNELIYNCVDQFTPLYYLILGHVELCYPSESVAAAPSAPKTCVVYPGSLFGVDHLVSNESTMVVAGTIDRALVFEIDRSDVDSLATEFPNLLKSLTKARERAARITHPVTPTGPTTPRHASVVQYMSEYSSTQEDKKTTTTATDDADIVRLGWQHEDPAESTPCVAWEDPASEVVHEFEVGTCCTDEVLAFNGTIVPASPTAMSGTPPGRSSSKASDKTSKTSTSNQTRTSQNREKINRKSSRLSRTSLSSNNRTGDLSVALESIGVVPSLRNRKSQSEVGMRTSLRRVSVKSVDKGAHVVLPSSDNQMGTAAPEVTDAEILEGTTRLSTLTSATHVGHAAHDGHNNAHAAIMIWLGILIDAVPESVVLGILASTSSEGSLLTFVIGVFLANLPEAMSSSSTMAACGISKTRIMIMWSSIVVLTAIGACIGSIMFPPGSQEEESSQYAIAAIEGLAGGAMLAMISNTALPEAFEQGGDVVGLSTVCGFLTALFVSVASS